MWERGGSYRERGLLGSQEALKPIAVTAVQLRAATKTTELQALEGRGGRSELEFSKLSAPEPAHGPRGQPRHAAQAHELALGSWARAVGRAPLGCWLWPARVSDDSGGPGRGRSVQSTGDVPQGCPASPRRLSVPSTPCWGCSPGSLPALPNGHGVGRGAGRTYPPDPTQPDDPPSVLPVASDGLPLAGPGLTRSLVSDRTRLASHRGLDREAHLPQAPGCALRWGKPLGSPGTAALTAAAGRQAGAALCDRLGPRGPRLSSAVITAAAPRESPRRGASPLTLRDAAAATLSPSPFPSFKDIF